METNKDAFNTLLLHSRQQVDQINKKFYGRYNYPWPPSSFPAYPANISRQFLNQDIGSWDHKRIPENARIWVAGCGTNQALFTALRFPECHVLGTDISVNSLRECRKNADQIGVSNLQLEESNLNEIDFIEAFDYIICTGVIHHNANPPATLEKISAALKPNGVLELMVYNYYHRLLSTSCQKAIRSFYDYDTNIDLETELTLIKRLIHGFPFKNLMGDFLRSHAGIHEAEMADTLIQPVEYSYTIESLEKMADDANLEYLSSCVNQFDKIRDSFNWNTNFTDPYLKNLYESLPDSKRWQITNLLMLETSPMLWFYFQRKDADYTRKTELETGNEFLRTKFSPASFHINNYELDNNGDYLVNEPGTASPGIPKDETARKFLNLLSRGYTVENAFTTLNIPTTIYHITNMRLKLTSSGFPYLLADL